jgi:hypothetical protein
MRVVILYHPKSEHGGSVEDYARDYKLFHRDEKRELELLSLETKQGAELARLYDIVRYPAVLAIAKDGSLQHVWQDGQLPLLRDLDFYNQS